MHQNVLLHSLGEAIQGDRLAEKVLLTESRVAGHTLLRRLALSGTPWVNVRCETPITLAQAMVADELAISGRTFADATMTLLLVAELIATVPEAVAYLAPVGDRPGVLRAVHRTLLELRLHGVDADKLRSGTFLDVDKGKALIAMLRAYEQGLAGRGWVDEADVFRLAISHVRDGGAHRALYLIPRGLTLRGLPRTFIEALPRDCIRPLDDDGIEGITVPPSRIGLDLFAATGPAAEVREVLRRVAEAGVPFEDVEILLARETPYLRAIRDAVARLGIPSTFAPGLPVAWTRPGRAALAYLCWVQEDFPVRTLADTLAAGDLTPPRDHAGEGPGGTASARILRRSGIGWGRDRYEPGLLAEIARLDRRGAEYAEEGRPPDWVTALTVRKRDTTLVLGLVSDLIALTPRPDSDGRVGLADFCHGLAAILERYCAAVSPEDAEARLLLTERLRLAGRWAAGRFPVPDAAERVLALVADLRVAVSGPQPGRLHVSGATAGGCAGRRHTFVVGLDESSFSGSAAEDPLLLDEERTGLDSSVPCSTERAAESLYRFGRALASLHGRVCFSYSIREPGEDRPAFPSPVLLQVFRLQGGQPRANYTDLERALGNPARAFPRPGGMAFDRDEAWLGRIAAHPLLAEAQDAVKRAYPHLERGEELLRARQSDMVTPYDGLIAPDPHRLDPRRNPDLVISASDLEALARCPLGYFFQYVLGIAPPDELVRDPGRWLDPMVRGSLLHDVYRRFYERLGDRVTGAPREEAILQEVCEGLLAECRLKIPPPSDAVYERERSEILASAGVFLMMERREAGAARPRFFEVGFGLGPGSVPPGAPGCEAPVVIPVAGGAAIRLRGRIDRIDQVGDHTYRVWDYKTGRAYRDGGTLIRGRRLQHALYEFAAEQMLCTPGIDPGAQVDGSGYRFPTELGEGQSWRPEGDARRALPDLLRGLLDLVAGGTFVAAEDGSACGWCDYGPACDGKAAAGAIKRKLDAGDPCLDPLRGVIEVE